MIILQLARAIANVAIHLDFSGEVIDEDDIVEIIEHLAIDLQDLDGESRKILSDAFRHIAPEYEGEFREYVETMPDGFGIE
jgi:hypothetical protein